MTVKDTAARAASPLKDKLQTETALLPAGGSMIDRVRNARNALLQGDLERSEKIYREILEAAPKNPDALHGLGTILLQRNKPEEAASYLELAVETGRVPAQFFVNFAVALESSGQIERALKVLRRAVSQDREDAFLHQSLGVFLYNRTREREALRSLQMAARLNPDLPRLQLMLGDIHIKNGRDDKALAGLSAPPGAGSRRWAGNLPRFLSARQAGRASRSPETC